MTAFTKHGLKDATIAQITRAAKLGFGTFYNYFESREDLIEALREEFIFGFVEQVKAMKAEIEDPAEKIASALRHTFLKGLSEPEWADFVYKCALITDPATDPMVQDFVADLSLGLSSGRFKAASTPVKIATIMGIVMGMYMAISKGLLTGEDATVEGATTMLLSLGLPMEQAEEVANRPLPDLPSHHDDDRQ